MKSIIWKYKTLGSIKDIFYSTTNENKMIEENDKMSLNMLQLCFENPHTSMRKFATKHNISSFSIHNIRKKKKILHSKYNWFMKSQKTISIIVEYSDNMIEKLNTDLNFNSVVFTDKATFML